MGTLRKFIFLFMIFAAANICAAEETPATTESLIIADMAQDNRAADAASSENKSPYPLKRYTVKEETDTVKRALDVFKKKKAQSSLYRKKFWIYSTQTGADNSYISFTTNDQNAGIVFSPDEEYVYYVETTPDGKRRLNGVRITTQDRFFVNQPGDFYIQTCGESSRSYVVVNNGAEGYQVYNLDGGSVPIPDMPASINDLEGVICR
jgi:hypothetical protein